MAKNASQSRESISDKIIFDMPVSVDAEFSSALRTVLVEASTASWEFWFGLLEQFKEAEGHCKVPSLYVAHNRFRLGRWVNVQRTSKVSLPKERKKKLNDLGFVWDALDDAWEYGFSQLLKFKEAEGHCLVPRSFEVEGYKLGFWVSSQRLKKAKLSTEHRQRLAEIGFIFEPFVAAWEKGFNKLVEFKAVEGHCNVTKRFKLDEFYLGQWVISQRVRQGYLSTERKQRLDEIGFIWDVSKDKT